MKPEKVLSSRKYSVHPHFVPNSVAAGLPSFLVIILFCPIEEDDFYIGKQSHAERAKEQGKPFVRIVSQHLARAAEGREKRAGLIRRLEDRYRGVLEAKNCEWEVSISIKSYITVIFTKH